LACKWWMKEYGCNNTNWISGKRSDPEKPVCAGLSFKDIPIKTK